MTQPSVLVLGGTSWLGSHVATAALMAGHEVTCLARGQSGEPPPGTAFVAADREVGGAYDQVRGAVWDLVVDVSWQPGQVRGAVDALAEVAARWVYVSSCSVYADQSQAGMDEGSALLEALPPSAERAERGNYGAAKVRCEQICFERLGDRLLLARPGLIAGCGDRSDRFGYWVGRLALAMQDGGPVLVPEGVDRVPAQAVAVADLSRWVLDAGMRGVSGAINAVGPHWTLAEVLGASIRASGFDGRLVRARSEWLLARGVTEYMGPRSLPLWLADPEYAGFSDRDGSSALAAGLTHSGLDALVGECLRWERELGLERADRSAGLHRSEELELISFLAERR